MAARARLVVPNGAGTPRKSLSLNQAARPTGGMGGGGGGVRGRTKSEFDFLPNSSLGGNQGCLGLVHELQPSGQPLIGPLYPGYNVGWGITLQESFFTNSDWSIRRGCGESRAPSPYLARCLDRRGVRERERSTGVREGVREYVRG